MPAAASQLGLQCQLQQQGGVDRAELSPASSSRLSLQLLGLITWQAAAQAHEQCICVCGLELELGHSQPSGPAPVRCRPRAPLPQHQSSRACALGAGAWNYLRIRIPEFELFFRAGPHPAGFFMGNPTHHPPQKQQHRGFEPLGSAPPWTAIPAPQAPSRKRRGTPGDGL